MAGKKAAKKKAAKQTARKAKKKTPPKSPAAPALRAIPQRSAAEEALDAAQEVMYDAWEASPRQAAVLARRALELSEDCADAYTMLGTHASSPAEAIDLFRKGLAAGERALGPRPFVEDVGDFWGFLETRPYMRARAALAHTLWALGEEAEALGHYRDLLRLNPNDNQGIRYVLMHCLLSSGDWAAATDLLEQRRGDVLVTWSWSRALIEFQRSGPSASARKALRAAHKANKHVARYLLGKDPLPRTPPPFHGIGDPAEAVTYVLEHGSLWEDMPGALDFVATLGS